jgi:hypothetical protein
MSSFISFLRKSGRLQEARLDPAMDGGMSLLDMAMSVGTDPEEALSREEMRRFIRDGMAQLPEKYRLPILYTAIEELDHSRYPKHRERSCCILRWLQARGPSLYRHQRCIGRRTDLASTRRLCVSSGHCYRAGPRNFKSPKSGRRGRRGCTSSRDILARQWQSATCAVCPV